jgi:hypothetical protein
MPTLSDAWFAAVARRAHAYEAPCTEGFDGTAASDAELARLGLPPRPDPVAEPALHAFWTRLLAPPLHVMTPRFPCRAGTSAAGDVAPAHGATSGGISAGAYLTTVRPSRVVLVTGGWTVPDVRTPAVFPATGIGETCSCLIWIGLDSNAREDAHVSLPRLGISQTVHVEDGGRISCEAFWQWWKKKPGPNDPETARVPIANLPVHVGDEILVALHVPSDDEVRFTIKNQTTGDLCTFLVIAPGQTAPVGTSAEWMLERPHDGDEAHRAPLPALAPVDIHHCVARTATGTHALAPSRTLSVGDGHIVGSCAAAAEARHGAAHVIATSETCLRVACGDAAC